MPELPKQVMCWHGQWPLAHAGTWATTRYPADAVAYVPRSDFDRVKAAAELGLAMAEANDLWNTAETIREALEKHHHKGPQVMVMIHDAMKVAYSSIVGQSIMLLNDKGACIGQLSVINCENPQEIADEVVAALKAPNRHAYQVGKKVGAAAQKDDGFNLYCPKCGSDEVSHGYSAPPFQGNVQCHADGCEVVAVADTEAKAKALWRSGEWTHELVDRDENGQPTYRPKERD